jgi:tetratricopeptide (TPR) repeat protein
MNIADRQPYISLLQEIIGSPDGNEGSILERNEHLINETLLKIMQDVSEDLKKQSDRIERIRLNLCKARDGGAIWFDENVVFIKEVFNFIAKGVQAQDYFDIFISDYENNLNENFVLRFPDVISGSMSRIPKSEVLRLADIVGDFGNLIQQSAVGSPAINRELAIISYNKILPIFLDPRQRAVTQVNLGCAYHNRINGDSVDNLERALEYYNEALIFYSNDENPRNPKYEFRKLWAITNLNKAQALWIRGKGEKVQNLKSAGTVCNQILKVLDKDEFIQE